MIGSLLEKLFVSVGVDLSGLAEGMREASREVDKVAGDLKRDFAKVGESWKATGAKMMKTGAVMSAAVTAPLALFGKQAAQAAIDAEEMQSAFEVVFGDMAGDVKAWAEVTGNAMGRSTQEIQRGALAFQELFGKALDPAKAADMSKQFALLTQDLASFKNLSNEVAQQKLFSGLTGEAEPLRAVGVFINEAALEAKLLELGLEKVNGKFTDQQKILGRAALIREQLANADGDVIRTADSAANRIRASQAAYEELSITVGQVLIPALTPLIGMVSDMLNGFNELDPQIQKVIVGGLALAAAIGPVVTAAGGLVTLGGVLAPMLGNLAIQATGLAGGFVGLLPALAPLLPIIAAIAAAGLLIYTNWDKIAPVLEDFWSATKEALGPPVMELIAAVGDALKELWAGPIGEGIRTAMSWFEQFKSVFTEVFGVAFTVALQGALTVLIAVFKQIGDAIRFVNAILTGDWSAAWDAAWSIVNRALGGIPDLAAKMVAQLREQLITRLDAIWQWVTGKIESVKKAFFGLYDAVVGHSYIPDMVDQIGDNMARLQALMVDPAAKATKSTGDAFRDLASNVGGVLDRLFPLQAQLRAVLEDMATLDKARAANQIDAGTYDAASSLLNTERRSLQTEITPPAVIRELENIPAITIKLDDLATVLGDLPHIASEAEIALQSFGESIGDTIMGGLRDVLTGRGSLKDVARDMLARFLERTITDALRSLETTIFGEGGLGGFIGGLLSSVISGRAVGGPVVPGRAYTVGAGEVFQPSQSGRVLSRNDAMRALGGGAGGVGTIAVTVSGARGNQEIAAMVRQGVSEGLAGYDKIAASRVNKQFRRLG